MAIIRIERELTEERVSFMQDAYPRDWMNLPVPDGRIVIGLDGGSTRSCFDKRGYKNGVASTASTPRRPIQPPAGQALRCKAAGLQDR